MRQNMSGITTLQPSLFTEIRYFKPEYDEGQDYKIGDEVFYKVDTGENGVTTQKVTGNNNKIILNF